MLFFISRLFDHFWGSNCAVPIISINDIYSIPTEYDNISKINLKLISANKIAIEGNKKFKLLNTNKNYDYYDTVYLTHPDFEFQKLNILKMKFEDSNNSDSVYVVLSKSDFTNKFYNQVFYSSVIINNLNDFSEDPDDFRINKELLVNQKLLIDNDSLIYLVFNHFNSNIDNLGIAECGTNCNIFMNICSIYSVPCRLVNLQSGDIEEFGLGDNIGYPLHVVCEIFSSKHQKWYVVDPTFGFRFKLSEYYDYLNAIEIANMQTFQRENEIVQDSILLTKRSLVGKDYFKFYENVIFVNNALKNSIFKKLMSLFFNKFNYFLYLYSNKFPINKNGFYYLFIKSFIFVLFLILQLNLVLYIILNRLYALKKPN